MSSLRQGEGSFIMELREELKTADEEGNKTISERTSRLQYHSNIGGENFKKKFLQRGQSKQEPPISQNENPLNVWI